jgi:hypothetical protein
MCLQAIIEWNGHGTQQGKVRDLLLCLFCNRLLWAVGNEIFLTGDVCCLFFSLQTTVSQSNLFDHLNNEWSFKPGPTPNSCHLHFKVDFQFRSPLYRQVHAILISNMLCSSSKFTITLFRFHPNVLGFLLNL